MTRIMVLSYGYSGFILLDKKKCPKYALHIENECRWAMKKYRKLYPDRPLPKITPHVYRHTFCTNMVNAVRNSSLKAMGFRYLQFIPCLDPIGKERGQEPYSLLPEAFGSFLAATFDDWYRGWEEQDYVSIRQFEDYVHLLLGEMPSSCTAFGRCGSYVVVEGDGSVYPCDFYVLDRYYEGNLNDTPILELATSQKARAFITEDVKRPEECGGCRWLRICHGGCKRDLSVDADGTVSNYYCPSFRFFFDYAYDRLCRVAEAERQAKAQYYMGQARR